MKSQNGLKCEYFIWTFWFLLLFFVFVSWFILYTSLSYTSYSRSRHVHARLLLKVLRVVIQRKINFQDSHLFFSLLWWYPATLLVVLFLCITLFRILHSSWDENSFCSRWKLKGFGYRSFSVQFHLRGEVQLRISYRLCTDLQKHCWRNEYESFWCIHLSVAIVHYNLHIIWLLFVIRKWTVCKHARKHHTHTHTHTHTRTHARTHTTCART